MDDGQEPTQPNNEPTPDTTPDAPAPKTFDEDYVKDLRTEAAKHRKNAREMEKQLAELRAAQEAAEAKELEAQGEYKTLAEKATAEAEQYKQELEKERAKLANERRTREAISIATSLGAIDPTDANFLTAVSSVDISADDATDQITAALEGLKEKRPYLFGHRTTQLSSFNPSGKDERTTPGESDEERRLRLLGGGTRSFFDLTEASGHGGGVVWPKGKPEQER